MADLLSSALEVQTHQKGIIQDSPLFIILFVCSSTDFEAKSSDVNIARVTNKDCQILQKLDPDEMTIFQTRLKFLVEESECKVEDMLSFVIMAEDFNENSVYIKKVVQVMNEL